MHDYRLEKILAFIRRYTSILYCVFMFCIYPLIYHNNYIDIQTAKYTAFLISSLLFLAVCGLTILLSVCYRAVKGKKEKTKKEKLHLSKGTIPEMMKTQMPVFFLLIFALTVMVSTGMSRWPKEAITGSMGRRLGMISLLLCAACSLVIAVWKGGAEQPRSEMERAGQQYTEGKAAGWLIAAFITVNVFEMTICILNFWGNDPLNMFRNLVLKQHNYFMGTVGNRNITSGYFCIVVPILLVLFYLSKNRIRKFVYAIVAVTGIYTGYTTSSDSFLIGCAGAFLLLLWVSLTDHDSWMNFFYTLLLFYVANWIMKGTMLAAESKGYAQPLIAVFPKDGLIGTLMDLRVLVVTGILLFLLFICEYFFLRKMGDRIFRQIRKWGFEILVAAAAVFLLLFLYVNYRAAHGTEVYGGWQKALYLEDEFGTNRGYIWKRSVERFHEYSLREKIFGCGPDCFYLVMQEPYGGEMVERFGSPFADAHNEFLQFLLTVGIAGVIGYFGFLLSSLYLMLKKQKVFPEYLLGAAALSAFLFQGIVNNPQIFTTPLIFVLIGSMGAKNK